MFAQVGGLCETNSIRAPKRCWEGYRRRVGRLSSGALVLALGAGFVSAPPAHAETDYSTTIATLTADIKESMAANGVVGLTIALVDGDRVVWKRGFGYADRKAQKRVTARTLFHIGSASKTASALAVMQLVQQGRVDLDEPLATYVPGFSLLPRYKNNVITVRTVLDHHSGIPGDVFNGMLTVGKPDPDFRTWLRRALSRMYPERRVNTVYAYNNSGYVLLQDLVENVTGMPFDTYAKRYIFSPAGMTGSTFKTTAAPASRLTRNYQAQVGADGTVTKSTRQPREYINGWTAGSITSSAVDMARYMQMLLAGGSGMNGRVLKKSTLKQMWTKQVDSPLDISFMHFGLGFAIGDPGLKWAGKVVWHDGATVWNHSMMKLLPGSDLGVFVSVNTAAPGGVPSVIADEALALAYTAKTGTAPPAPQTPPKSPVVPADGVARHIGYYGGTSALYSVEASDAGLTLTSGVGTEQARPTALLPHADGWFRPAEAPLPMVRFRTIEGRKLMLMRLELGGALVTLIAGEKVPPSLDGYWRTRLGRYKAVDDNPDVDPSLLARTIVLRDLNGLLLMALDSEGGVQPLTVRGDHVAFTAGLGTGLGRGKGECVIPGRTKSGVPTFTYFGVKYRRVDS